MPYKDRDRQNQFQKEWIAERRSVWLKENGPCKNCGSWLNLEIDHIDGATKISHKIWSWTEEKRLQELSKCQILCQKCHLQKTLDSRPKTEHGKGWMYIKYKCRCIACVEWKSASDKKYKRKCGRVV